MAGYSADFVKTVAVIAATAMYRHTLTPEQAVDFAWFSVNEVGDAAVDDGDFIRHFNAWRRLPVNA